MPGEVLSGGGNVLESFGELEQCGDTGAVAVEEGAPAPSWGVVRAPLRLEPGFGWS